MSNRCSVCDLLDGYGSELYENYHRNNRVRWRPIAKEYICDDCARMISDTVLDMDKERLADTRESPEHLFHKDKFLTANTEKPSESE